MQRLRFSLRLMLIVVALIAVVSAWAGLRRNQWRTQVQRQIRQLEIRRKARFADERIKQRELREIDAEIATRRRILGE
jgi:hypothetical protein